MVRIDDGGAFVSLLVLMSVLMLVLVVVDVGVSLGDEDGAALRTLLLVLKLLVIWIVPKNRDGDVGEKLLRMPFVVVACKAHHRGISVFDIDRCFQRSVIVYPFR